MSDISLDPAKLMGDINRHRVVIRASLTPINGDRFQPAGFPEIGHVIYRAPRPHGRTEDVCIVDSAASMANHLETVCLESPFGLDMHSDLIGLPYVECWTDQNEKGKPERLVVTSLSEGHRLASSYFVSEAAKLITGGKVGDGTLIAVLKSHFSLKDIGKKSHPLPADWWNVFATIFRYDPNSLVHGILFPSLGIKIPRVLTAALEAFGAARVASSGVKFDRIGKTDSGQPIFAVDEETANEIRATFVLDLSLIRSFGHRDSGLRAEQKRLLLEFALWKIHRLLAAPFRFRSNCDLRLNALTWSGGDSSDLTESQYVPIELSDLGVNMPASIEAAFQQAGERVTKVYWPAEELFRQAKDHDPGSGGSATDESEPDDEDEIG